MLTQAASNDVHCAEVWLCRITVPLIQCQNFTLSCSCVEVGTSARLGAQVAKVGVAGTVAALAEQHGVFVSSLLAVNGLPANPVVRCGQMLQIP